MPNFIYDIRPSPSQVLRSKIWEGKSLKAHRVNFRTLAGFGRDLLTIGFKIFLISLLALSETFVYAPTGFELNSQKGVVAAEEPNQAELEQKLQEIESQIDVYEDNIRQTQAQGKTLKGEVDQLTTRIKKLNLQILSTELEIKHLSRKVASTTNAIEESKLKISQAKNLLERSLQAVYETDQLSLLEVLLVNEALSEFFSELSAQNAIQVQAKAQLDEIKVLKVILEKQKEELVDEKEDQVALLLVQGGQRKEVGSQRQEKDRILAITKGKESLFQQLLRQSQKTAAEIRAQLYRLLGGGEIKFEDALRYAEFAASNTGIRPALLLAVMDKESEFGRDIGRCSWKTAMHPTRDQPAYSQITKELDINPDLMLVSCPILRDGSYGGAMGMAQFLPSTWMIYRDKIQAIVGHPPSPWNPQDAFVATALYLVDLGASSKTYEAERKAAAKYYAGKRWYRYLRSYGDRVMRLARHWQEQIDILKRTASL